MSETTIKNTEPVKEEAYTLRALEAKDVFLMVKIIGAIGIAKFADCLQSDEIRNIITGSKSDDGANASIGMVVMLSVADVVVKHLPDCEKDIYQFLSSLSGMDRKKIESLPIDTFIQMVIDVFQKEEFGDFMKAVSRLFK